MRMTSTSVTQVSVLWRFRVRGYTEVHESNALNPNLQQTKYPGAFYIIILNSVKTRVRLQNATNRDLHSM